MATLSCYDGNYTAKARVKAAQGVAVAMVDFRNCISPSSVPEVAPFPAGSNDCVSGLEWVAREAEALKIDKTHIIVAGESGGGNLAIATGLKLRLDGKLSLIRGLHSKCPYIAGLWPLPKIRHRPRKMAFCSTCTIIMGVLASGSKNMSRKIR